MLPDTPDPFTPAQDEALDALLLAMSEEELDAIQTDPDAVRALLREVDLRAAIEEGDPNQMTVASNRFRDAVDGPLFTDTEWALISEHRGFRHLATDPTARAKFEFQMRQDPDGVQTIKRLTAEVASVRNSALSPGAKQFLLRIGIGLVIGLIVLSQSRN